MNTIYVLLKLIFKKNINYLDKILFKTVLIY